MIGNIDILVKELCKLPKEVGWVEFKHNNCEPNMVGEDISALANTATLNDRDYAYMIWGVNDTSHEIIGTKVRLQMEKKGEQELENWLRYMLSKNADFEYYDAETKRKVSRSWKTGFAIFFPRMQILNSMVQTSMASMWS